MKVLLAPAHFVLGRVGSAMALLLVCVLALAPALAALLALDALPRDQLYLLVGALCVSALHALVAWRSFVSEDIARVIQVTDRLASGELLVGVQADNAATGDTRELWASVLKSCPGAGARC